MNCKHLSFILIMLASLSGQAQTTISGTAPQWIGKTIQLYSETDPISRRRIELGSDTIAPDGGFILKCNNQHIKVLWMAVKRFRAPLFVEPNTTYEVAIATKPENQLVDTWRKGSFEYGFQNLDSTDINSILGDFDNAYYNFYLDNARYINSPEMREKIQGFENQNTSSSDPEFVQVYRQSTFAQMKHSAGADSYEIYKTYLSNRPVHPENPAWYSFFDLFYADYFQRFDSRFGGATISNRIKMGMSPDSLSKLIDLDPFMANDTLKQWVLLKSVDQVYENSAYSKTYLHRILNRIHARAKTTEIAEIAQRLNTKIENQLIGLPLDSLTGDWKPAFELPKNQLPTVLMVGAADHTESEKEEAILQSLVVKYSDIFNLIEVKVDGAGHAQPQSRTIYRPGNDYTFLETFEIYGLPYFIWVDRDGRIAETNINKPSKGLESRLYKLKVKKEKERQIKVGQ